MNDIFPSFYRCCFFEPRVTMMLIAVFYVIAGSSVVLVMELEYKGSYTLVKNFLLETIKFNFIGFFDYTLVLPVIMIAVGVTYVVIGVLTIFGQFFDQEEMVKLSAWMTLVTICVILGLALLLGYSCAKETLPCVFGTLDYLTISLIVMGFIVIMVLLVYFMIFINTQVEEL